MNHLPPLTSIHDHVIEFTEDSDIIDLRISWRQEIVFEETFFERKQLHDWINYEFVCHLGDVYDPDEGIQVEQEVKNIIGMEEEDADL